MKKRIFLRVFFVMLLAVSLVFSAGIWTVHKNSETLTKKRLEAEAELLSVMIKGEDNIRQLEAYENTDVFRITVVREGGEVLYESSIPGVLENHADREEIALALEHGAYTLTRYSETFGCNMTYYAVSSTLSDGDVIVIRLAVKQGEINSYLSVAIPLMLLTVVFALAISVILATRLSTNVSGKINEISDSLKSLNEGEYHPLETSSSYTELYSVLLRINDLNEKTHKMILSQTEERRKLSIVLDNVSEGIIALGHDGRIIFANNAATDIFGGRECVGRELEYLCEDPSLAERIRSVEERIDAFDYERQGRDYRVSVSKTSGADEGSEISRIAVIADVTKEKSIAREKSDFFANASHELKTPITVMQGHSELLLSKSSLTEADAKRVERIYKECVRLSYLISDMLKLSVLERGSQAAVSAEVNLYDTVQEAVAELAEMIKEKRISCTVCGSAVLRADKMKIYELVSNLLTNAVRYNKDGGRISVVIESGDGVTLTVRDSGIGIPAEHIPRLCERFYRVDKSRSKKTGGTGLGLAIVKHICATYGAELTIKSEVDVGTAVSVRFPCDTVA